MTRPVPAERLKGSPPYVFAAFSDLVAEKRRAGVRVLSLAMGDPDQPTFGPIVAAGTQALQDPRNHRYPTNRGREEFRRAIAGFYARRFGVGLDPSAEVLPAIGAKECLSNLCLAFLEEGTAAIAPAPGYPVYRTGPLLAGAEVIELPLRAEAAFSPAFDALEDEDLRRARILFLNYPNNPTGAIAAPGLFEEAVRLARDWNLLLVHDNPYSEVGYDGYVAPSLLAVPGAKEVAVEVFSFSKAYNMAGWRCAAVVGNASVLDDYWRLKSHVDVGVFDVVQLAATAALAPELDELVRERNLLYQQRRDAVCDGLRALGCRLDPPQATIYVWAPIPSGFETSAAFSKAVLDRAGVLLTPGSAYGPRGEGFFRISLGCPAAEIGEALERLSRLNLAWTEHQEEAHA
jgi:LL-diaminopimelate aminotransferase